jgi:hypothetical protein
LDFFEFGQVRLKIFRNFTERFFVDPGNDIKVAKFHPGGPAERAFLNGSASEYKISFIRIADQCRDRNEWERVVAALGARSSEDQIRLIGYRLRLLRRRDFERVTTALNESVDWNAFNRPPENVAVKVSAADREFRERFLFVIRRCADNAQFWRIMHASFSSALIYRSPEWRDTTFAIMERQEARFPS